MAPVILMALLLMGALFAVCLAAVDHRNDMNRRLAEIERHTAPEELPWEQSQIARRRQRPRRAFDQPRGRLILAGDTLTIEHPPDDVI